MICEQMRRRVREASLTALVASVFAAAVLPPASAQAAAPASTGPAVMSWAATYMADDVRYTRAEAEDLARVYDVVAGVAAGLRDHVEAMRRVNPDLTLLAYTNGMLLSPQASDGVPESEFAHDLLGRRITSTAFGNYLMEPSSASWRNRSIGLCQDRIALSRFDGCLVDMFGTGIFSRGYLSALPRLPGSRSEYTPQQWSERTQAFARQFVAALPDAVLVANAVGAAPRYFAPDAPSKPMALAWPGAQAEDYMRGAADPVGRFPSEAAWLRTVDMISDIEAGGGVGFYSAKLWVPATSAQVAQWQALSMATVLMGANGRSFYSFSTERTKAGATGATAPFSLPRDLGAPSGDMVKDGAVYRRPFGNGLVLVNPTASPAAHTLTGSFRALDGTTRSGTMTLPPNSAEVLVADSAACPSGLPPSGFTDVGANQHRSAIDCAVWYGVVRGTDALRYSPDRALTRGQMASLLAAIVARAGQLPESAPDTFVDDAQSVHQANINKLAALGVVRGVDTLHFKPEQLVTRGQIATLLVGTHELLTRQRLPRAVTPFTDIASDVHGEQIGKAYAAGLVRGTSATTYFPGGTTRRDQAASLVARELELLVDAGLIVAPTS